MFVLHNHIEKGAYIMISTMDSSDYILSVLYINVCDSVRSMFMWCSTVLCLWVIFIIVCCVIDTLANIYALEVVICMCLYRGGGGPVKIFAPPSIPVMVMCVILWQNEQTRIKQTSTWRTKTRQAQSEVNSVAMTSCSERLNYLFYRMMK